MQVNTDQLEAGHGRQAAIGAAIGGSAGVIRAAGEAVAAAAGHAGASAAGSSWSAAWETELVGRAELMRRAADNLAAAAVAYRETDEGQMRT